jgi:hypothetical protein
MLRRQYVQECYLAITSSNPDAVVFYRRKSKEQMLRDYFSFYGFGRRETLFDQKAWDIFACRQRTLYLRMNLVLQRYAEDECPCYICARVTQKTVLGDWYITHLLHPDFFNCYEEFNVRIICYDCRVNVGHETPNVYATSLGLNENNSLAIEEAVESLERGIMLYFHSYAPHPPRFRYGKIAPLPV